MADGHWVREGGRERGGEEGGREGRRKGGREEGGRREGGRKQARLHICITTTCTYKAGDPGLIDYDHLSSSMSVHTVLRFHIHAG